MRDFKAQSSGRPGGGPKHCLVRPLPSWLGVRTEKGAQWPRPRDFPLRTLWCRVFNSCLNPTQPAGAPGRLKTHLPQRYPLPAQARCVPPPARPPAGRLPTDTAERAAGQLPSTRVRRSARRASQRGAASAGRGARRERREREFQPLSATSPTSALSSWDLLSWKWGLGTQAPHLGGGKEAGWSLTKDYFSEDRAGTELLKDVLCAPKTKSFQP